MPLKIANTSTNIELVNALAKSYNVMHFPAKLRSMLKSVYVDTNFDSFTKPELHKMINNVIINSYSGEEVIKYYLAKEFLKKKVVAAFEMRVNTSRVDFLTINGDTKSFEIKSSLDNLYKLEKQVHDYERVFEYNFIVIDERHYNAAIRIVPERYGIYVFNKNKNILIRDSVFNQQLESDLQLRLFNKKELGRFFKLDHCQSFEVILEQYSKEQVNECFKQMLKDRYKKKWDFVKANKNEILPIDFQFFYQNNISPRLVYGLV